MLTVSEIYRTILGESRHSGRLCTLVRLTGCHRRCVYCDSDHAFAGGREREVVELIGEIDALGDGLVLVTGGEPLLQPEAIALMAGLRARGREVVLETSGTLAPVGLDTVPDGVTRIVDLKAPGSGIAADQLDWAGIAGLGPDDEIKVVCRDRRDYAWAREVIRTPGRLPEGPRISLSASHGELAPDRLAGWIIEDGLDVRFQIQLHKTIWPGRERGI